MSMRIKAFLIHGLVSISVALLVIGLVFFIWYPSPLAKAVGVTHIFFNDAGDRCYLRTFIDIACL